MSPQQLSQCCRVVRQRVNPSRDGIWITNDLLRRAFERYCAASKPARRHGSNVPGPLESRRRLGKRHMGGLESLQSTPSLPVWALPSPVDLSQLRWEPPTSTSTRQRTDSQPQRTARSTLACPADLDNRLVEMLEQVTEEPENAAVKRAAMTKRPVFLAEFDKLWPDFAAECSSSERSRFRAVCDRLQKDLSLGLVPPVELHDGFNFITDALSATSLPSAKAGPLYNLLVSAVVNGLASSRVVDISYMDLGFWNQALVRMAAFPVCMETFVVFGRIMRQLPIEDFAMVQDGVMSLLRSIFASWAVAGDYTAVDTSNLLEPLKTATRQLQLVVDAREALHRGELTTARLRLKQAERTRGAYETALKFVSGTVGRQRRQTQALAEALKDLRPDQHREFFEGVVTTLISTDGHGRLSYYWLSVVARMQFVKQDALFDMCSRLSASSTAETLLSDTELGSLLVSHWQTQGYLPNFDKEEALFHGLSEQQATSSLAALMLAIWRWRGMEGYALASSLCAILRHLGRLDELVPAFESLASIRPVPRELVRMVAVAADDPRIALRLLLVQNEKWRHSQQKPLPEEWHTHVDKIILDPAAEPADVWSVLGLDLRVRTSQAVQRYHCRVTDTQAAIIEAMAVRLPEARHLRKRVILRHLSHCVNLLSSHNRTLSPRVLQALYTVLAGDLKQASPGVTAVWDWFLRMLRWNYGSEVARDCQSSLRRWRRTALDSSEMAAMVDGTSRKSAR